MTKTLPFIAKSQVCKQNKNKVMDKYYNTLKMMGVNSKDALFFADALKMIHLTINPEVRSHMRKIILETVIMGKTCKEWFIYFSEEGQKRGFLVNSNGEKIFITLSAVDFDRIDNSNIVPLLELVLQEYYREIKILG